MRSVDRFPDSEISMMNHPHSTVRATLAGLLQALEGTQVIDREALFHGRDALRATSQLVQEGPGSAFQPLVVALNDMVETMIRTPYLGEADAMGCLRGLVQALVIGLEKDGFQRHRAKSETAARLTQTGFHRPLDLGLEGLREGEVPAPRVVHYGPPTPAQRADQRRELIEDAIEQAATEPVEEPEPATGPAPRVVLRAPLPEVIAADENKIGQILLRKGKVTGIQLDRALALQRISGRRLGEILVAMGAVGEPELNAALERQQLESLDLSQGIATQATQPTPGASLRLIPPDPSRRGA